MTGRIGNIADESETHRVDIEVTDRAADRGRGETNIESIDAGMRGDNQCVLSLIESKAVNMGERGGDGRGRRDG
ncbi:hypothetical protein GCM10011600_11940 [Pseudolysinimonas yzui]|uniref:Uncharacterized protein n=1 Tax=Pseudolysinimonas yzui TaxID=2708254 RepID=A0A8J3M3K3_9MICO|nr:hypothetical protein GCM10011600_11940 [Pseudolysinimonas yzui]